MNWFLTAAVVFVTYPAIAGIVYRALGGGSLPQGEHEVGRGRYRTLRCDGPWTWDFCHCQRCADWKGAVLAAWTWPVAWIVWLPGRIFRAASNVTVTGKPEHAPLTDGERDRMARLSR